MIDNDVHAMFVVTVTMGVTTMLMAWIIFVIGVKTWAVGKRQKKSSPRA